VSLEFYVFLDVVSISLMGFFMAASMLGDFSVAEIETSSLLTSGRVECRNQFFVSDLDLVEGGNNRFFLRSKSQLIDPEWISSRIVSIRLSASSKMSDSSFSHIDAHQKSL